MSTIVSENFDGVTAPAIPTGWVAAASVLTETTDFISSPNGVTGTTANTDQTAYYNTSTDGNGGDAQASVVAMYVAGVDAAAYAICRMTTVSTTFINTVGYYIYMSRSSGIVLGRTTGAGAVSLGTKAFTPSLSTVDQYRIYCRCLGTSIKARVQRLSDSKWLDSSASWQTAVSDVISVTNSVITGAGKAGFAVFRQTVPGDKMAIDDFLWESIVTRSMTQVISF